MLVIMAPLVLRHRYRPEAKQTRATAKHPKKDAMSREDDDDSRIYRVVVNHEEQYSLWPQDRPLPGGWRASGMTGTKLQCMAHVDEVWTDMRPLSVRQSVAVDPAPTQ